MGLSASQARLLTITARKSDCEFQSMRYSHEKIALSRDLTDVSNEYQNALNATKLVYDYYGLGSSADPLSYGLLMTPSEINGYLPILTTDNAGRVVLNSKYAAAARAAGIPNEGFGALPSSTVRDSFIMGMVNTGLISPITAESLLGIQYSQDVGVGNAGAIVTTKVEELTFEEMLQLYEENKSSGVYTFDSTGIANKAGDAVDRVVLVNTHSGLNRNGQDFTMPEWLTRSDGDDQTEDLSLRDILKGDYSILMRVFHGSAKDDPNSPDGPSEGAAYKAATEALTCSNIWSWLFGELRSMLNVAGDDDVLAAINEAEGRVINLISAENGYSLDFHAETHETPNDGTSGWEDTGYHGVISCMCANNTDNSGNFHTWVGRTASGFINWVGNWLFTWDGEKKQALNEGWYNTSEYIGVCRYWNWADSGGKHRSDGVSISVSNIAKAYLTIFAEAYERALLQKHEIAETTKDYKIENEKSTGDRTVAGSTLFEYDDIDFKFKQVTEEGINADQALISGFYDALFNQICLRGWTENDNVNNKEYLQEMYKSGKFFMTSCADDGFYYQGNYATNTMIKEVTDEEAIARAEAKYNTQKQKINHKEEIIDMKMKNLDTEISSLTTEYETIKSVLKNNIDKSFTRYDA